MENSGAIDIEVYVRRMTTPIIASLSIILIGKCTLNANFTIKPWLNNYYNTLHVQQ